MTTDPSTPSTSPSLDKSTVGPSSVPAEPTPRTVEKTPRTVEKTRAASSYAFIVVGALVTLALVVFIVQNLSSSPAVNFFGWSYQLPVGINMLIAALAGAIVTGLAGSVRILQLRRAYKKR